MRLVFNQSLAKNKNGFTLVELLIVLAIASLLVGLVGPLTIRSLAVAEARTEVLSLKNWLRFTSHKSYLQSSPTTLVFKGKKVDVIAVNGTTDSKTFEHLFFDEQQLTFSAYGYVAQTALSYNLNGEQSDIDLMKLINRDEGEL